MPRFLKWINSFFGSRMLINNTEYVKNEWEHYKDGASKRLGTGAEALKTLRELESEVNYHCGRYSVGGLYFHSCKNDYLHSDILAFMEKARGWGSRIIGNPDDVHHIIPPTHSLGYGVYKSIDGSVELEVIEDLYKKIEALRKNGRIIAFNCYTMMRHENYRGHHIC